MTVPHPRLHIGTSGWSYPWQGIFYPPDLPSAEYLPFYAQQFDCTEINSCFYHFTMPKTVEKWLNTTPSEFRFAPKMHQEITHECRLVNAEAPLEKFMSRFLLMGDRLGPVLIQIPASLRFVATVAEGFFKMLRKKYPESVFAFEARHVSWFSSQALNLLREYSIALVIATSGGRFPSWEAVTADTVYFRLHGDEKLYDSAYSDEKLEHFADMIRDYLAEGKEIWVFFNNTMKGQAIGDSERLRLLL